MFAQQLMEMTRWLEAQGDDDGVALARELTDRFALRHDADADENELHPSQQELDAILRRLGRMAAEARGLRFNGTVMGQDGVEQDIEACIEAMRRERALRRSADGEPDPLTFQPKFNNGNGGALITLGGVTEFVSGQKARDLVDALDNGRQAAHAAITAANLYVKSHDRCVVHVGGELHNLIGRAMSALADLPGRVVFAANIAQDAKP